MSFELRDKEVVVIGGSGVLGASVARQLVAEGSVVRLIARTPSKVPDDLRSLPVAQADVRRRESLTQALSSLGSAFDGVVNATGVVAFGSLAEVPPEIVEELFAVNAIGVMNVLATGSSVVRDNGFIVSLSGVAADMAILNMSAYCASKSAAHAAMAVAARELRRRKINVIDARAPHTETGLTSRALWGAAPTFPAGLSPESVAQRIVAAVAAGEADLPADAFHS